MTGSYPWKASAATADTQVVIPADPVHTDNQFNGDPIYESTPNPAQTPALEPVSELVSVLSAPNLK